MKFNTVVGVLDETGKTRILAQELLASEHRFKNLTPKDVIYAVYHKCYLKREEDSDRLIVPLHTEPCEVILNPKPSEILYMFIWNRVVGRWELWASKKTYWVKAMGADLDRWLRFFPSAEKKKEEVE